MSGTDTATKKTDDGKTVTNDTATKKTDDGKTVTNEPKKDEFGATVQTLVVTQPLEEEEDETCYIEYRELFTDENNVQQVRVHRVPRENWDRYAKKHGF